MPGSVLHSSSGSGLVPRAPDLQVNARNLLQGGQPVNIRRLMPSRLCPPRDVLLPRPSPRSRPTTAAPPPAPAALTPPSDVTASVTPSYVGQGKPMTHDRCKQEWGVYADCQRGKVSLWLQGWLPMWLLRGVGWVSVSVPFVCHKSVSFPTVAGGSPSPFPGPPPPLSPRSDNPFMVHTGQ